MPQKNEEKGKAGVFGRLYYCFAAGAVRTTDAPNRYVPTSRIAENAGGRSTEYRDKIWGTPQAEVNDCDAGTYRQVRPMFPKRADAYDVNGDFHTGRCPKKMRRKEKREYSGGCTFYLAAGGIRATDAPNRYVPTSRIAENAGGRSTEYRDAAKLLRKVGSPFLSNGEPTIYTLCQTFIRLFFPSTGN